MILLELESDFPMADFEAITKQLLDWNILVPGFHPPNSGLLSWDAIQIAEIENVTIVVLADRNIISKLETIARGKMAVPCDLTTKKAAHVMAFAQMANWDIEPAIAYHELAQHNGNCETHNNLAWFRAADGSQYLEWIDIALGRAFALPSAMPVFEQQTNFEQSLHRWKMNYILALKIAELDLSGISKKECVFLLSKWMENEFIFAAPALLFASMFLSPRATKKGMFKNLRGKCREKAVAGVKNEAWDITYISEFVRLTRTVQNNQKYYVLATADRSLAALASLLVRENFNDSLLKFSEWWDENDAQEIAEEFLRIGKLASQRSTPEAKGTLEGLIEAGEVIVGAWTK